MRRALGFLPLALMTATCAGSAQDQAGYVDARSADAPHQSPAFAGQYRAPARTADVAFDVVTVAKGLQTPRGLAFLPDGRMLVTEQPGRLRIVSTNGTLSPAVAGLPVVDARGQGGLLGLAVDPGFATKQPLHRRARRDEPGAVVARRRPGRRRRAAAARSGRAHSRPRAGARRRPIPADRRLERSHPEARPKAG